METLRTSLPAIKDVRAFVTPMREAELLRRGLRKLTFRELAINEFRRLRENLSLG
jgi:hypothetical protein